MRTLIVVVSTLALLGGCKKDQAPAPKAAEAVVAAPPAVKVTEAPAGPRRLSLQVTEDGFKPDNLTLQANQPVTFVVTRTTDATCATDLLIEGTDIKVPLPLNAPVEVAWTPTKAGSVKFGCAMDYMVGGVLVVQ